MVKNYINILRAELFKLRRNIPFIRVVALLFILVVLFSSFLAYFLDIDSPFNDSFEYTIIHLFVMGYFVFILPIYLILIYFLFTFESINGIKDICLLESIRSIFIGKVILFVLIFVSFSILNLFLGFLILYSIMHFRFGISVTSEIYLLSYLKYLSIFLSYYFIQISTCLVFVKRAKNIGVFVTLILIVHLLSLLNIRNTYNPLNYLDLNLLIAGSKLKFPNFQVFEPNYTVLLLISFIFSFILFATSYYLNIHSNEQEN
ncbi:MAG: hypothetical protein CFE22_11120 [Cytophagaceae bacterium BCCC1]|nr:MAG: hypothetical protein CFE22_11120 [Cytophagaceae bacterium BCCC1]